MAELGRPSSYEPKMVGQAHRLVLMGYPDETVAYILGLTLAGMAKWAWEDKQFFDAITPSDEEKEAWKQRQQDKKNKRSLQRKRYFEKNPSQKIRNATSARLWAALKYRTDDGALFSRLGYSVEQLKEHLEKQFIQGMSWANYGKWHVDHKIPVCKFNQLDSKEFAECWALSNLQPLWATDNLHKGAKHGRA